MNELYHHGIKGQKWGVRRYQNPDGSLTSLGKKKLKNGVEHLRDNGTKSIKKAGKFIKKHESEIKTYHENSKRIESMSDQEIQRRIRRLENEKKLKELEKPKVVKGADTAKKILSNSGVAAASTVLTAAGVYAVKKAIEKKWGKEVVKEMFPKKGK